MANPMIPWSVKPGQSYTFSVTCLVAGVLTNASTLALTLQYVGTTPAPPGSTTQIVVGSPINDTVGAYHADVAFPMNAAPGTWARRWQSTGAQPNQNALRERTFYIDALDF